MEGWMAYDIVATTKTPALIVYLIDISGSMDEEFDGARKIEHVMEALDNVLHKMVERSTKGEIIAPRYRLAMAAYSDSPQSMLPGGIETIAQVAKRGKPHLSATHSTDTHAAFVWARDLLRQELPKMKGMPAPMVCHLTDGEYTGADPEPIAREIMSMSNDDGNVLVENIFIGPDLMRAPISSAESWEGIQSEAELQSPYARKLFAMSSPLPASYSVEIAEEGYSLKAGARMLIPGSSKDLIELAFAMSGATPTA
jgi:hypothetical protein